MSYVSIRELTKNFKAKPPTRAIDDLTLEVEEGEFLVLLGPSGCGKTTTLRCLAGLETPDSGQISFGGKTVFDAARRLNISPEKRNIGMVFQSYALWPHMTVRKNIRYPLKARRLRQGLAENWTEETAQLVDCGALLDRFPGQLSGGQQQRVALARGLVARPDLVLFDEPLSNLDARLRDLVREEIHELHERLHFTAVFVTHDQSEALALGDRLAIMRAGRLEQFDKPQRVFEHPATEYVAAFVGLSNRLALERREGSWTWSGEVITGELPVEVVARADAVVRLRPDDVHLGPIGSVGAPGAISTRGRVVDAEYGGRHMDVIVTVGGDRLHARVPCGEQGSWARRVAAGDDVDVSFFTRDAQLFEPTGARIDQASAKSQPLTVGA